MSLNPPKISLGVPALIISRAVLLTLLTRDQEVIIITLPEVGVFLLLLGDLGNQRLIINSFFATRTRTREKRGVSLPFKRKGSKFNCTMLGRVGRPGSFVNYVRRPQIKVFNSSSSLPYSAPRGPYQCRSRGGDLDLRSGLA